MRRALLLMFWLLIAPIHGSLLAQAATPSHPAVTTSGPIGRPDVRVGDWWKYRVTDRYTKLTQSISIEVTSVAEGRISTRRSMLDTPVSATAGGLVEIWDRDWNQIRAGDTEFTPFYPVLKFPLEPGTQWAGIVHWYSGSGTLRHQLTAQAAAWERVVVPAGSFDAIRIVVRGTISETGSINYYAQTGSISGLIWYAPLVGQIVKKEFVHRDDTPIGLGNLAEQWELLEYKRN